MSGLGNKFFKQGSINLFKNLKENESTCRTSTKKKKMEMLEQKSIRNERSTKWTSEQIVDCRRKGL